MVRTCRRLSPLVITKASVIDNTPPTSRTTVFSAFLAEAAWAAVITQCRMVSRVATSLSVCVETARLPIEILADDDGDIDDVERLAAQQEPAGPKRLAHTFSSLLFGPVVEHDLCLSVGEAVGVSAQHDTATDRDQTLRDLGGGADGARPVEHLDANAT